MDILWTPVNQEKGTRERVDARDVKLMVRANASAEKTLLVLALHSEVDDLGVVRCFDS